MPNFRIKRPHSPDFTGIANYKRLRLIEDLQNLSISDNTTTRVVPETNPDQVWKIVSGQSQADRKFYDRVWDDIRKDRLKVIKWYDGAKLLYQAWLIWLRSRSGTEMEVDDDQNQEFNDYGCEPMLVD
ncbi:LAQU0S16e02234g1_1 [Lachancea quebecensis]|uniref:LAQU0S16e02234g1_1 n=1 Tax=Lachancea quebecensis TaxID=1654605 RepID=A0A0P1KW07_9SACH|nr:LAQU0S16e02234g1_1 [Lachancea quebecensis]